MLSFRGPMSINEIEYLSFLCSDLQALRVLILKLGQDFIFKVTIDPYPSAAMWSLRRIKSFVRQALH